MSINIFTGIKVIEFSSNVAGTYPAALMADYGADVIKVEAPIGDSCRGFNPQMDGMSTMFAFLNRGKRSVALNLRDEADRELAKQLIADADVVTESGKPGTMEKFGFGYEELKAIKKNIIMCRISAYGQTGPERLEPGHDLMAQAESGAMDVTGEPAGPPEKHGFALSAYTAATYAFGAISAALFHRERTGEGQCIDISLLDSLTSINDYIEPAALGHKASRTGRHHALLAPFGVYDTKNGFITLAALTERSWRAFCGLIGRAELATDERYLTAGKRMDRFDEVTQIVENWVGQFTDADEPIKLLKKAGVPCSKILSAKELLEDEQLLARGMLIDLEMPSGRMKARGNPINFSSNKPNVGKPPILGEHNGEVFRKG